MSLDLKSLPEYHIENNVNASLRLHRVPQVFHPLTNRFASEVSELGPDEKDWCMTVRFGLDGRRVELNWKLADGEQADPLHVDKQLSVSLSATLRRQQIALAKMHMKQLAVCSKSSRSSQPSQEQPKKSHVEVPVSVSSFVQLNSDVSISRKEYRPSTNMARHAQRRKTASKRLGGQQETWKLLDHAYYQKAKSREDTNSVAKKLAGAAKSQFVRKQIPLEPVEKLLDPRQPVVSDLQRQEVDLTLVVFSSMSAEDGNVLGAEKSSLRPIDVVIGMRARTDLTAEGVDSTNTRQNLMESMSQRLQMLEILADDEFTEAVSDIRVLIDSKMARHYAERHNASCYQHDID